MKITALAGGVGASKVLSGLQRVLSESEARDLTIIVNTGDDIEMFGLYIAPDLDIVTYTLAGVVNPATGWGIANDSFHCLERLIGYLDEDRWFNLGDRDLATHIYRTQQLRAGKSLTEVADKLRRSFHLPMQILPMSDLHTPTTIVTADGEMHFQEYLIRRRAEPTIKSIRFENIELARPAAGVLEAILEADVVIVCPSNPLISIGPIVAVPGIRQALVETTANVVAISPVVGGASLKGPTDRMLRDLGMEVTALQVARLYRDFVDLFLLDEVDEAERGAVEALGIATRTAQTVMKTEDDKERLARSLIEGLGRID
jgi:LPPG:FO 2-phospho-L-lactate transferase